MSYTIDKEEIDIALFKFLKSIYLFEQREVELFKLKWNEVYLLQLLIRQPGMCVSEISKELRVLNFETSRMIKRLEKEGLVRRENANIDKRVVNIYITEGGLEKVNNIEAFSYETVKKNFDKFPEETIHILLQGISQLDVLLDLQDMNINIKNIKLK